MLKNNGFHNRHSPILRAFSPLSLFSGGAPGAWYDPSDLTTLFQDSAGTTPVTAVEQPVGRMLDKSQGLVLGPELFTGVIAYNLNSTISIVGNTITATCTVAGQFGFISQSNLVTNGVFAISGNISANPSGKAISVFPNLDGAAVSLGSALISFSLKPFAPAAGGFSANSAFLVNGGIIGDSFSITLASVKKIAGNHAFQSTSASRPVLSARYNLLTKTEQFDDAVWTVTQATKTPAQLAPDGTNTAVLVTGSAGNNVKFLATTSSSAATSNTFRFYVKNEGANFLQILYLAASGTSYANFNISTGTLGPYSGAVPTIAPSEYAGWSVITFTETTNAANSGVRVCIIDSETAARNSTTTSTGSFTLWHPSFVPTNQSTLPYQRVNTSTDYNTTGFLPYLKFDGVDDSLSTNSISFTSTDKMSVFAGVRKLSDAALGVLAELSANINVNAGSFGIFAPVTASSNYSFSSRGSVGGSFADASGYAAPITNTLTALSNISGDLATLRLNGAQVGQSTADQGTGNYGNYPLYIGRRGGTSFPFNGQLYSMVIVGKAVTAGELLSTETYVNQKTGAY